MNANEFLTRALAKISDDPEDRIPQTVKDVMKYDDCLFDPHCHIFDRKCLDSRYFLLRFFKETIGLEKNGNGKLFNKDYLKYQLDYEYLAKTDKDIYAELSEGKIDSEEDWHKIEAEIDKIAENEGKNLEGMGLSGLWRTFTKIVLKDDMEGILKYYLEKMAVNQNQEYINRPLVTSILMMDLEQGWGKPVAKSMSDQIQELKDLSEKYAILPFVALDPRRENLYDLFIEAFDDGRLPFFGVKFYPSLGYLPSDERLLPIYEVCQRKNIPILTHCGGEIVSTFSKNVEVKEVVTPHTVSGESRKDIAFLLNDPDHWEIVLDMFPYLKLNFGHFGGDSSWEQHKPDAPNERIEKIISLMRRFRYVYADFSFNVIDDKIFDNFRNELYANPLVQERSLFGTDFWVVLPSGNLLRKQAQFLETVDDYQKQLTMTNPRKYLFDKTIGSLPIS